MQIDIKLTEEQLTIINHANQLVRLWRSGTRLSRDNWIAVGQAFAILQEAASISKREAWAEINAEWLSTIDRSTVAKAIWLARNPDAISDILDIAGSGAAHPCYANQIVRKQRRTASAESLTRHNYLLNKVKRLEKQLKHFGLSVEQLSREVAA